MLVTSLHLTCLRAVLYYLLSKKNKFWTPKSHPQKSLEILYCWASNFLGFLDTPNIPMKAALYVRVSTHDQQTLPHQLKAMRGYAKKRGWSFTLQIKEVGSGAKTRPQRKELLKAARRQEVDAIIVWRFDRWGRSLADLVITLKELSDLSIGFV
jgi:resolvase-like protein